MGPGCSFGLRTNKAEKLSKEQKVSKKISSTKVGIFFFFIVIILRLKVSQDRCQERLPRKKVIGIPKASCLPCTYIQETEREREGGREKDWGIFPLTSKDHHPHKAFSIKRGAATTPLPSARARLSQARELGARTSLDIRALLCVCVAPDLPSFLPSDSFSNCKCLFFTFFRK